MKQGNIGVTTENIFPVIKKFLYSDHEIFLREIVSNAVDATQKLRTLVNKGEAEADTEGLHVSVVLDKEARTITVSDRGIGMTADEVERYINQIAFSGANDFLDRYKDDAAAIIGHFGLGFYSAFMVADSVTIVSRSHTGAEAVRWTCDGSPSYTMEAAEREERGTDIIMHLSDDCQEFADEARLRELLVKYCKFLPVAIKLGDETINNTEPLWQKKPAELGDEDYLKFYRELYPMQDDPLFWIHLNVDYPFNLTGVLYFPKLRSQIDVQRNRIQLYCNQVFVTDNVEGIVPEFLLLLHGIIDSPDIPLNVSRSYLQSDQNVKKISQYITKKVADRLASLFKEDRAAFEQKWDDLRVFIHYGMLCQDDFYDKAKAFLLLSDVDGKRFTLDEYTTLIKADQTDKDGRLVVLYAQDSEREYAYIEAARAKGYSVLLMDGQLDTPLLQLLERKLEQTTFVRVDSDVVDRLIAKEDVATVAKGTQKRIRALFGAKLPKGDKLTLTPEVRSLGAEALPVQLTQSEYMRRMKEMARLQPGMAFYGDMPDMYTLVINADSPIVSALTDETSETVSQLIDLALLQNGLLRGEALARFVRRSVDTLHEQSK